MLKKRNAKNTPKKSTSKTTTNNKRQTSLAEKTEQILLTMPKIIATQIGKDLLIQKQQELKLKTEFKKSDQQKKTLSSRMLDLKKKTTQAAKKQIKTTQKTLQKTTQALTGLTRDLEATRKQIQTLAQKKSKYTALQAQLISFQKEWAKNLATKNTTMTTKKKSKTKATRQKAFNQGSSYQGETQVLEVIDMPTQEKMEFSPKQAAEKIS